MVVMMTTTKKTMISILMGGAMLVLLVVGENPSTTSTESAGSSKEVLIASTTTRNGVFLPPLQLPPTATPTSIASHDRQRQEQQEQNLDTKDQKQRHRVLIIGGGISGLAAAHKILSANEKESSAGTNPTPSVEVTILEAKARLGGRIYTLQGGVQSSTSDDTTSTSNTAEGAAGVDNTGKNGLGIKYPVDMGGTYWHGGQDVPAMQEITQLFPEHVHEMVATEGKSNLPGGEENAIWKYYFTNHNNKMYHNERNGYQYHPQYHQYQHDGEWIDILPEEVKQSEELFEAWTEHMIQQYHQYTMGHKITASTTNGHTTSKNDENSLNNAGDHQSSNTISTSDGYSALQEHAQELLVHSWSESFLQTLSIAQQAYVRHLISMSFELDRSLYLHAHSLSGWPNNWDWVTYSGGDQVGKNGMLPLIDMFQQSIRKKNGQIHLSTRVERIEYDQEICRVYTTSTTTSGSMNSTASSMQTDVWEADACVVTIPLGVMKDDADHLFDPSLPQDKLDALDRAGVGLLNTALVEWNQPICEVGKSAYHLVDSPFKDNPLRYGFICPGDLRQYDNHRHLVQFYLIGWNYPFDDVDYWKEMAWEVVQAIVPTITVDDIVQLYISRWHLDPDVRGAYSAPTTESRGNSDRQILANPVGPTLFFAGEHTHYKGRYQSIDGAYETGTRAAFEILQVLEKRAVTRSVM